MELAVLAFLSIFILIGSAGLFIALRAGLASRLSAAITPDGKTGTWLDYLRPRRAGESLRAAIQPFDRVLPRSPQEVSVAQKRLIRAGFREDAHLRILYGSRVIVPIVFAALA